MSIEFIGETLSSGFHSVDAVTYLHNTYTIEPGDLIIGVRRIVGNTSGWSSQPSHPAWTQIGDTYRTGTTQNDVALHWWYRFHESGDPTDILFGWNNHGMLFRGVGEVGFQSRSTGNNGLGIDSFTTELGDVIAWIAGVRHSSSNTHVATPASPNGEGWTARAHFAGYFSCAIATGELEPGTHNISVTWPGSTNRVQRAVLLIPSGPTSEDALVEPDTAELTLNTYAAEIATVKEVELSPTAAVLGLDTYEPTLDVEGDIEVSVLSAQLTVDTYEPVIDVITDIQLDADAALFDLATYEPELEVIGAIIEPEDGLFDLVAHPPAAIRTDGGPQIVNVASYEGTHTASFSHTVSSDPNYDGDARVGAVSNPSTSYYIEHVTSYNLSRTRGSLFKIEGLTSTPRTPKTIRFHIIRNGSGAPSVSLRILRIRDGYETVVRHMSGSGAVGNTSTTFTTADLEDLYIYFESVNTLTTLSGWARMYYVELEAPSPYLDTVVEVDNTPDALFETYDAIPFSEGDVSIDTELAVFDLQGHPAEYPGQVHRPPVILRPSGPISNSLTVFPSGTTAWEALANESTSTGVRWTVTGPTTPETRRTRVQLPSVLGGVLPEQPHIIRWNSARSGVAPSRTLRLHSGTTLIRSINVTTDQGQLSLTPSDVAAIQDWDDLWLEFELYVSNIQPGFSGTSTFYSASFEVPNSEGVIVVRPDAGTLGVETYPATITSVQNIPPTKHLTFVGHGPEIFPEIPMQSSIFYGSSASPFLRVLDAVTRQFENGWPTIPGEVVDVGVHSEGLVAVAHRGGAGFSVIDGINKTLIEGYPSVSRDTWAAAITPAYVAVGHRRYTDANLTPGTALASGLTLISNNTKQPVSLPNVAGTVFAVRFSPDGTKLAVGCSQAPYFRVINLGSMSFETNWPQPLGPVTDIVWRGDDIYLAARGGVARLNANTKQAVAGWKDLDVDAWGIALSRTGDRIAAFGSKLVVINTTTLGTSTPVDVRFPGKAVEFVHGSVVSLGVLGYGDADAQLFYYDISTGEFPVGDWPSIGGTVRQAESVIPLSGDPAPPPQRNVTVEVGHTNRTFSTHIAEVSTLTEIRVDVATLSVATYGAEVIAASTSITDPLPADVALLGHAPRVFPDNVLVEVTHGEPQVETYTATVAAVAPLYKLIDATSSAVSARDAEALESLDLGVAFHGDKRTARFCLGNISGEPKRFAIYASGSNGKLVEGVSFSLDGVQWRDIVQVYADSNGLSEAVHMRVETNKALPSGKNTFLLQVESEIGI